MSRARSSSFADFSSGGRRVLLLGLGLLWACGGGSAGDGGPDGGGDMTRPGVCDGAIVPAPDLLAVPTGRKIPAGDIGAPCATDADCKKGSKPVCFKQTLFNSAKGLPVPGGYCSAP